ncbi:unnamed protein product, partial [Prorocentrum cordatum]
VPLRFWSGTSPGPPWAPMPTTKRQFWIPRVRHVSGPCWESALGDIKDHVQALQEKSAAHGWSLCYWSHEAMDAEMDACADAALREAYFSIDPAYMVVRSDLFRLWVLCKFGGMWLDLRGAPADDADGIGLEAVPRHFGGTPPPLLFCYGGQHKEKFGGLHGEIINGFMMGCPGLQVWQDAWRRAVGMICSYPDRWRRCARPGQHAIDDTLDYFDIPVAMTGREGVLCMGPLSMTKVVREYLCARGAMEECVPSTFRNFWSWSTLTPRGKTWAAVQGRLLYRDPEKAAAHMHYSKLTAPIVRLGEEPVARAPCLALAPVQRRTIPLSAASSALEGGSWKELDFLDWQSSWWESLGGLPVIISDSTFTFMFGQSSLQDKVVTLRGQAIGRIIGRCGSDYVSLEHELIEKLSPADPGAVAAVPAAEALPADGRQQRFRVCELAQAHWAERCVPAIMSFAESYASKSWLWGDPCPSLYASKGLHLRKPAALWILRVYLLAALYNNLRLIFCIGWNSKNASDEYKAQADSPLIKGGHR